MMCIQVEKLTKQFGEQKVVDHVSFTLEKHTATALIGPNGAGKTTTIRHLMGFLKPDEGSVTINGL
ncbi:MAG: ATP-binding cassette domain-containing protein, partial [Solibacillus sp.]